MLLGDRRKIAEFCNHGDNRTKGDPRILSSIHHRISDGLDIKTRDRWRCITI
jgi:hypothetical protein